MFLILNNLHGFFRLPAAVLTIAASVSTVEPVLAASPYESLENEVRLLISQTAKTKSYGVAAWGQPFPEFEFGQFMLDLYKHRGDVVLSSIYSNIADLSVALVRSDTSLSDVQIEIVENETTSQFMSEYENERASYNPIIENGTDGPLESKRSDLERLTQLRDEAILEYRLARLMGRNEKGDSFLADIESLNNEIRPAKVKLQELVEADAKTKVGSSEYIALFNKSIRRKSPFTDLCPQMVSEAISLVTIYSRGYGKKLPNPNNIASCLVGVALVRGAWQTEDGQQAALRVSAFFHLGHSQWYLINIRSNFSNDSNLIYSLPKQEAPKGLALNRYISTLEFP